MKDEEVNWTVAKLVEATHGKLLQGELETPLNAVSTDTRGLQKGDCFVALPGEHHDGHDFIPAAVAREAGGVIVSRKGVAGALPRDVFAIEVPDTLYALGELARYFRQHHRAPLVGVTGSNGKTSTKEMTASILGETKNVLKNKGNFNNLIGVPLTLLSLRPEHEVAVVEMGINIDGEMERLVEISGPTAGLITNIQPAHLEGLRSLDHILEEKGKLLTELAPSGLAVINLDDGLVPTLLKRIKARTVVYSLRDHGADVYLASDVKSEDGASSFQLAVGKDVVSVRLPVLGLHHVQNAAAAAAVAYGMGESPEAIVTGLAKRRPVTHRMQMFRLRDGTVLVDDTYNANPMSTLAAVEAVSAACGDGIFIAVLGEMKELGPESARLHREVGRRIGALGVNRLIVYGGPAAEIIEGYKDAGGRSAACVQGESHDEIVKLLCESRPERAWILVKGSRSMAMERVVEGLLAEDAGQKSETPGTELGA